MKKELKKFLLELLIIVIPLCAFFVWLVVYWLPSRQEQEDSPGVRAVRLLYSFTDVYDLADNDARLKEICDEDAYKTLSPTNETKALSTYLKFGGDSTEVVVVREHFDKSGGYVLYSLRNSHLSENRLFLFLYSLDENGKITNPRELAGIDFLRDSKDVMDYTIHDFKENGDSQYADFDNPN